MYLSLIATIAVFGANIFLTSKTKLALALFIICNICYIAMFAGKNNVIAFQNAVLMGIAIKNYVGCCRKAVN